MPGQMMFAPSGEHSYNYSKEVLIQSQYPAHLKYRGRISGKLYEWPKAGDVVSVLEVDVDELLAKKIGSKSCCGQTGDGNQLFKLYS